MSEESGAPVRKGFIMSLGAAFGSSLGVAVGFALGGGILVLAAVAALGALLGIALARLFAPSPSRGPTPSP